MHFSWPDFWHTTSPECVEAIKTLCSGPLLKHLRGCATVPVEVWCYNPNLTTINISDFSVEGNAVNSSGAAKQYAPLQSFTARSEVSTIGPLLDRHPGLFSSIQVVMIGYVTLDWLPSLQRLLNLTANTVSEVTIHLRKTWFDSK